jgi:hypothetical protein
MNKFTPFFIPDSHKRICESGLSGQQHIENGSGVDGLQALQAVSVLNVRWRIARRSRPPQMDIFNMLLRDQVKSRQNCSRNKTI